MSYHLLKAEMGHQLPSVTSTNEWIKNKSIPAGSWVIAQDQTNGKGRGSHSWITLGEDHIIFSGKIQIPISEISLPLFSIFTAAAMLRSILAMFPEMEAELSIKWPNDIYRNDKKIAGILIESEIQSGICTIIIGLGMNVYGKEIPPELEKKVCYLLDEIPLEGTVERLTYSFIEQLNQYIIKLIDPSQIFNELIWIERHSFLKDQAIETEVDSKIIRGKVLGIDEYGFLIIMTDTGEKVELMDSSPNFRVI